jgi:Fe-S oxidoreductase
MYHPKHIIGLIAGNIRKSTNPFGAPNAMINTWWKDIPLRREGDAMLFTGLMYQSMPFIEKTTRQLELLEDTRWAGMIRLGAFAPKILVGLGFRLMTSREERRKFNDILKSIHKILVKSNVDFFYRPELDFYSGVLLYDLGDQDGFVRHASRVAEKLERYGVRKLITVDPHTTYAMKVLYPKYTGKELEVKTYFELADIKSIPKSVEGGGNGHERVTLHDPCFYGRYLHLADEPLRVLGDLGVECVGVRNSGTFTNCCGGPAESISPKLNREILGKRTEELQSTGAPVVAMCPICLGNLLKAGVDARDLSTLVAQYA